MELKFRKQRGRRYARRSTRRIAPPRDPRRVRLVIAAVCGALAVIVAALVWGSVLKAKSDAYRASKDDEAWTVTNETEERPAVPYPEGNAISITPGNWVDPAYAGVILDLGSCEGNSPFDSAVLDAVGEGSGSMSAADEVDRLHRKKFTVTGVFEVTSLSADYGEETAYRRVLEMALLMEYARAGVDDLLLVGVPTGTETADAAAMAYLSEVKACLAQAEASPSVGVVLPVSAYAEEGDDGVWTYLDHMTPGRMLTACDYVAVDLTEAEDQLESQLKGLQYPYGRYGLRLWLDGASSEAASVAEAHGFERVLLYIP